MSTDVVPPTLDAGGHCPDLSRAGSAQSSHITRSQKSFTLVLKTIYFLKKNIASRSNL